MQRVLAAVTCAALFGGCAKQWPRVTTVTSPELRASATRLYSIDILPIDLEVWTDPRVAVDADLARTDAEGKLVGSISEAFYRRGYGVGAVMDWGGAYVGDDGMSAFALTGPEVHATIDSLASYGTAVGSRDELPAPFLPVRLGTRTGSDATLYVGGWGFIGVESQRANKVANVVLVAVLIVGVIAIAMIAGKHADKLGGLGGAAAKGVARAAVSIGRTALRAGNVMIHAGAEVAEQVQDLGELVDVFGRSSTHITIAARRPTYSEDKALPRRGAPRMYLEMTLVDNRTGDVVWHAHQRFPANATKPRDIARATRALLATLPAR